MATERKTLPRLPNDQPLASPADSIFLTRTKKSKNPSRVGRTEQRSVVRSLLAWSLS